MGLNLERVGFKPFTDIGFLDNLTIGQLAKYLQQELNDIEALSKEINTLKTSTTKAIIDWKTDITPISFNNETFNFSENKASLISKIQAARQQKVSLVNVVKGLREQKESFGKIKQKNSLGARTGSVAHENYTAIWEALHNRVHDLRETYDSGTILEWHDKAVEEGITFEEAYELYMSQSPMERASNIPEGL